MTSVSVAADDVDAVVIVGGEVECEHDTVDRGPQYMPPIYTSPCSVHRHNRPLVSCKRRCAQFTYLLVLGLRERS